MPSISVVIPVYNGEGTIEGAARSVCEQSFADMEVIIVDDGSTDGTPAIIDHLAREDGRIRVITNEKNLGSLIARKIGIRAAAGEFLAFLDDDDELIPGICEALSKEMAADAADILHFGMTVRIASGTKADSKDIEGITSPYPKRLEGREVFEGCFIRRLYCFNLCGKLFRTEVCKRAIEEVEDYDLVRGEDAYIFCAIALDASSYRGVEGLHGYLYNYGAGADGSHPINLEQFERMCDSHLLPGAMMTLLESRGLYDRYRLELEGYLRDFAMNSVGQFLTRLAAAERPEGYRVLMKSWGVGYALPALALLYSGRKGEFARAIKGSSALVVPTRPVRHVGMYCHGLSEGGAQNDLGSLAGCWTETGREVTLFLEEPPGPGVELPHGVDVVLLDVPSDREAPGDLSRRLTRLTGEATRRHLDVMVHHEWLDQALLWDMLALKRVGVSTVVCCHGAFSELFQFSNDLFVPGCSVYSLADAIVTSSEVDAGFWRNYNTNVFEMTGQPVRAAGLTGLDSQAFWSGVFGSLGRVDARPEGEEVDRIMWDTAIRANGIGLDNVRARFEWPIAERDARIGELEREIAEKDIRIGILREDIANLVSSVSFRSGRALTWLPRSARDMFREDVDPDR